MIKQFIFITTIFSLCMSCGERAKEADVNGDELPDVLVKNNQVIDYDERDDIFVYDQIVVNAVTNEQWHLENGILVVHATPTFRMEFNSNTKEWTKVDLN